MPMIPRSCARRRECAPRTWNTRPSPSIGATVRCRGSTHSGRSPGGCRPPGSWPHCSTCLAYRGSAGGFTAGSPRTGPGCRLPHAFQKRPQGNSPDYPHHSARTRKPSRPCGTASLAKGTGPACPVTHLLRWNRHSHVAPVPERTAPVTLFFNCAAFIPHTSLLRPARAHLNLAQRRGLSRARFGNKPSDRNNPVGSEAHGRKTTHRRRRSVPSELAASFLRLARLSRPLGVEC